MNNNILGELAIQRHCIFTRSCHYIKLQSIRATDNLRERQTQKLLLKKKKRCRSLLVHRTLFPQLNIYAQHAVMTENREGREAETRLHQNTMN